MPGLLDGAGVSSRAGTWACARQPGSDPWTYNRTAHPSKNAEGRGRGETRNANMFTLKTLEDTEMIIKWKLGKENPCGLTEIP